MIDDPPLLTIRRNIERPERSLVDAFASTPTGFIVDAMEGRGALDRAIKPLPGTPARFAGTALPCLNGPADNLALAAAVAVCAPGDVLVAATDGFNGCAVVGDLLLGIAKNRGAVGFVTDGLLRDLTDIQALGFPAFAAGVSPNSPARNGPGTVGLQVVCGGLPIAAGDIVVGDPDGVVIVPRAPWDPCSAPGCNRPGTRSSSSTITRRTFRQSARAASWWAMPPASVS